MSVQTSIFETEQIKPERKVFDVDNMMLQLEKMNRDAEKQNRLLQSMIDELQDGWSEDEKLQISNPKEYERQQKLKQETKPEEMPELTAQAIETLKSSKVEGTVIKLPEGQLDRKTYLEVKQRLELIGGSWKGGKVGGFVFQEDPTEMLNQIANGDKRNIKKEYQFFATPDALADQLVELADIPVRNYEITILEPSAGQGAIVKAINRAADPFKVHCYELMPVNQSILKNIFKAELLGEDFLTHSGTYFDYIVANPPFSKNQDIDHIRHMYAHLKSNGTLVSIASNHWQYANNKKETDFRFWLESIGAEIIPIEAGAFKESGTTVGGCIIKIVKEAV